jgi:phage/plasmid-like protein (TIGR03299 family)
VQWVRICALPGLKNKKVATKKHRNNLALWNIIHIFVLLINTNIIMDEQIKTQMLERNGLNWKVVSEGMKTDSGIVVPDRIALVREDTKKILGVHADGYEIYQNDELLELLHKIGMSTGLSLHTGGCFKGGDRVWFQLKSNDHVLNGDVIKGYISGFNSFDGRASLAFGNSKTTVSCQNTFWMAYRQVETRMRHSANMRPKIEEILRKIDILMAEEKSQFQEIERLHNTRMTAEVKDLITKRLFEIAIEERLDSDKISTNKGNKIKKFNYDLGVETAQKGDSLWGLFSGVTRYTTHSMKNGDNSEGKMFGKTGVIERDIYKTLVEMAI